jgi:hypothetical protein
MRSSAPNRRWSQRYGAAASSEPSVGPGGSTSSCGAPQASYKHSVPPACPGAGRGRAPRLGHALQAGELGAVGEQQQRGGLQAGWLVAQAPGVAAGRQALQVQRVQRALERGAQARQVACGRALERRQEARPGVPACRGGSRACSGPAGWAGRRRGGRARLSNAFTAAGPSSHVTSAYTSLLLAGSRCRTCPPRGLPSGRAHSRRPAPRHGGAGRTLMKCSAALFAQSSSVSPPVARWFIDTLVSRTKTTIIAHRPCVRAHRSVTEAESRSVLPAQMLCSHNVRLDHGRAWQCCIIRG